MTPTVFAQLMHTVWSCSLPVVSGCPEQYDEERSRGEDGAQVPVFLSATTFPPPALVSLLFVLSFCFCPAESSIPFWQKWLWCTHGRSSTCASCDVACCLTLRSEMLRVLHKVGWGYCAMPLGGAALKWNIDKKRFLLFHNRASAECWEATETLLTEQGHAGADWLLHSNGRILHERVC